MCIHIYIYIYTHMYTHNNNNTQRYIHMIYCCTDYPGSGFVFPENCFRKVQRHETRGTGTSPDFCFRKMYGSFRFVS